MSAMVNEAANGAKYQKAVACLPGVLRSFVLVSRSETRPSTPSTSITAAISDCSSGDWPL